MAHEILVDLFKTRPALAAELLVEVLGLALPRYAEARLASADLTAIAPAEYRADVVVHLLDDEGVAIRAIVVEVQLGKDPSKRLSWPAYVCVTRACHGCPVDLLVIAPANEVATWCAEPISIGPPSLVLTPVVLRRDAIPVVTDPAEAARRLELGMLSILAHGESEHGRSIAGSLLPAIAELDEERGRLYLDLLLNSVNEATRRALEAMMKGYEYQSDFAKRYVAQGRAEGRAQGEARALLAALRARGIPVPDADRERILAELDTERLERWVERAVVASSLAEVLDDLGQAASGGRPPA
jgi:hypothetical protein